MTSHPGGAAAHLSRARCGEIERPHMPRELRLIACHLECAGSPVFHIGTRSAHAPLSCACATRALTVQHDSLEPGSRNQRVSHFAIAREMGSVRSDASTDASTSDSEYVSPGVIGACLTIIPNAMMWYGAIRGKGKLESLVKAVVKSPIGPAGLLAVPFCGMAMEKCFYDTLVSLQGVNPNIQPETRKMETYPAGGHALPSFSVVPVKHIREYF